MTLIPEQIVGLLQTAGIPAGDLILWKGVTQLGNDAYQMLARIVQSSKPEDLRVLNEHLKEKFTMMRTGDIKGWNSYLVAERDRILKS